MDGMRVEGIEGIGRIAREMQVEHVVNAKERRNGQKIWRDYNIVIQQDTTCGSIRERDWRGIVGWMNRWGGGAMER